MHTYRPRRRDFSCWPLAGDVRTDSTFNPFLLAACAMVDVADALLEAWNRRKESKEALLKEEPKREFIAEILGGEENTFESLARAIEFAIDPDKVLDKPDKGLPKPDRILADPDRVSAKKMERMPGKPRGKSSNIDTRPEEAELTPYPVLFYNRTPTLIQIRHAHPPRSNTLSPKAFEQHLPVVTRRQSGTPSPSGRLRRP